MREYEWYFADRPHTPEYLKFDVLVTTYDTLIGDFDVIGEIPWRVTIVDEAHRLRNVKGKLLECMKEISAKGTLQYGFQSRVLMTGTPLQNNTQELWTLLNFIEPYKFPSLEEFEENFGNMNNRDQVEALQRNISPFMLRRVKEDVAKDIPAKEETLIDVELTSIQKQYYRAIFEHNHSFLSMGSARGSAPKLMNIQMELRKCCNHPFLLDGVETRELEKRHKELFVSGDMDGLSQEEQQALLNNHGYIQTSGKMVLLDKLLPKLRQEGHKVLIFSQMVKMLDLISEYCDFRGFRHERLDGRVRGNERQKAIDRFETEEDSFIFLLSTRAGGVGINLTAADICIIFDSDWNPQNDVQAQARCHRIGQTKDVMIYRLITSRTFEQEMFDRASKKLGLEQAVLGTFDKDGNDGKPSSKEMEQLLKKGAYALLEDENDEMGKEFCADDIESILAKRTRTRVVEGAKTASWLNKQGMNVSKSKFTGESASATANVDVDDPLFWQKVMPDFVTPTIMMAKLDDLSKVIQKQNNDQSGEDKIQNQGGRAAGKGGANDVQLSRTSQKKVNKFMSDLKSMMDGIFEEEEDDALPQTEKATCQKLLLTISVKAKLFAEDQRNLAKVMLKRLEGDRRRRCRTGGGDGPYRFKRSRFEKEPLEKNNAPQELLIIGKQKRKKRRQKDRPIDDDEADEELPEGKRQKTTTTTNKTGKDRKNLDEDGYLHHSDSEGDWSDVADDVYHQSGKKKLPSISKKEARRRRAWASDKDAATAAGRPWPSFPRRYVMGVLGTMLDQMTKVDASKGGLFSVPVPKDAFPEYYEVVKKPMDYGTMKKKLANGGYRSAQAMQKDFVLVMSNCLQFNAPDSDIVREARHQALMRPNLLKEAAMKNGLFISEDGSVLEIITDDEESNNPNAADGKKSKDGNSKRLVKRKKKAVEVAAGPDNNAGLGKRLVRCRECEGCKRDDCGECIACQDKLKFGGKGTLKQGCLRRQCLNMKEQTNKVTTPQRSKREKRRVAATPKWEDDDIRTHDQGERNESDEDGAASDESSSLKKPRIRISLAANGSTSSSNSDKGGIPEKDAGALWVPVPRKSSKKKKKKKQAFEGDEGATKTSGFSETSVRNEPLHGYEDANSETPQEKKKRKKRKLDSIPNGTREDYEDEDVMEKTSTTRTSKQKKKKKRHREKEEQYEEENEQQSVVSTTPPARSSVSATSSRDENERGEPGEVTGTGALDEDDVGADMATENDPSEVYMNLAFIKEESISLDGSFTAARSNMTKRGPWALPSGVGEGKFRDVARQTLSIMCKHDAYQLFMEEVTEEEAPGYSDVVINPMDFGTMLKKVEEGKYGKGSGAAAGLYSDFLLVFDNCALYNEKEGEVVGEAARILGLLPEAFTLSCVAVAKSKRNRKRKK